MNGSLIKQAIKEGEAQQEKRKAGRVINVWTTGGSNENKSITSMPSQTIETGLINPTKEIAPSKNFQKVPNSLARQAVPDGLFKGKSKQLYDALYSLTRGAMVPIRRIRIRKSKLMKLADIGSRITFESNVRHLELIGFIKERAIAGSHDGNEFEVFLPEESLPSQTSVSSLTSSTQKLDRLVRLETSQTRQTLTPENKELSEPLRLSFKTINTNDDEAFAAMNKVLADVCEKVSGKTPVKTQEENWKELAELLAIELEIAAARTKSISNVPAFLTEHLRRRLLGNAAKLTEGKLKAAKSTEVKKPQEIVEEYKAELLSKEGREAVVKTMREYIEKGQQEFVMSQQYSYTQEDWSWLMKQLEKNSG